MNYEALIKDGWIEMLDGQTYEIKDGDKFFVRAGAVNVTQSGGSCRAYESATLNASAQSGGYCRAYGSATLNASAQSGGDCWAYDSATLNASAQSGGDCGAYDSATLNVLDSAPTEAP